MSSAYAIVTPVRDEAEGLPRLIASVAAQTMLPETWLLVENGSTDESPAIAQRAADVHPWIRVVRIESPPAGERGVPIVRAIHAGVEALRPFPSVVAQLDADLSLPPDYFERLVRELDVSNRLGMVSGTCYELEDDEWKERFTTGANVWGAARAYRRECLESVLPFVPRTGWDAIDVAQANALGWQTRTLREIGFRHHRAEASRERTRFTAWADQGRTSYFLGYRPSYLLLRALFRAPRDPGALGLVAGYAGAARRRDPRCEKPGVREWVRGQQRLRTIAGRAAEARGRRGDSSTH